MAKNYVELERINNDENSPNGNDNEIKSYNIDELIDYIGAGKFHYKLMFFTGFIFAADSMEVMLLSFLVPILKCVWSLAPPEDGLIESIVFVGQFIGTTLLSSLSDKIGRKKVVLFSNFGCALAGLLSGFALNTPLFGLIWILICRFFVGFCIGGVAVSYTLFAEYTPSKLRAKLLILQQVCMHEIYDIIPICLILIYYNILEFLVLWCNVFSWIRLDYIAILWMEMVFNIEFNTSLDDCIVW